MNNNYCLVLHNQDSVKDILLHTGLVRHLYKLFEQKIMLIVKDQYYEMFYNYYGDLEELKYEVVPDLSNNSIFKLVMGKFKNNKIRMFFGEFDKYRLDEYKNIFKSKYNSIDYDPYKMYNFDENIRYSEFKTDCINKDCMKLVNLIRSVANMDYRVFSKGSLIPLQYKKNSTIAVHIDKIFTLNNFFDSVVLIEKSKYLHLTDHESDDFSLYMYYIFKSGHYPQIFDKKHIYLFHQGENCAFTDLPQNWNIIKYIPDDKLNK